MLDFETFLAPVYNAIVDDPKAETGKRDAQYIPARDIPAEILTMIGYSLDNKRHPHNIPGMAWDLTVGNWRNMKNAKNVDDGMQVEVVCDVDEKSFSLI